MSQPRNGPRGPTRGPSHGQPETQTNLSVAVLAVAVIRNDLLLERAAVFGHAKPRSWVSNFRGSVHSAGLWRPRSLLAGSSCLTSAGICAGVVVLFRLCRALRATGSTTIGVRATHVLATIAGIAHSTRIVRTRRIGVAAGPTAVAAASAVIASATIVAAA